MPKKAAPLHHQKLYSMLNGYKTTQMLYVAAELRLADKLKEKSLTIKELALNTGAHENSLFRLMRALASIGVFHENTDGRFTLTGISENLCTDSKDSLLPFALSYGASWWWNSFGELLHSVKSGESGFSKVHNLELFEYLEKDKNSSSIFNNNMSAMTRYDSNYIIDSYDFSSGKTIIDIGGGHGKLIFDILTANQDSFGILFDRDNVIKSALQTLEMDKIDFRCELMPGDFFSSIPSNGNIYLLKDILHDWDDERAENILTNCHSAMNKFSRLLVIERVISERNIADDGKIVDITMLALTGGRERTLCEYRKLFNNSGFDIINNIPLESGHSILEITKIQS